MTTAASAPDALGTFIASMRGSVLQPGEPAYEAARKVWNAMIDRRPALIARCSGAADVIEAVNYARQHSLPVSVKCGGHNVAGTAVCDAGMMIDLTAMRGVRVDPEARTVRVQGGAVWADVDRETQVFGLAAPSGYVSKTGVAGFTLGGGYGALRRKYGMTCDNLISADVVTADGRLVTASETENEDLLWALRGGGGNFGVVTSFEFKCYEVGPMVQLCAPFYAAADAATVIRGWRDYMATAPEEIASNLLLWNIPNAPMFPPELAGAPVAIVAAMVPGGDLSVAEKLLAPLRGLAKPLMDLSSPMPYCIAQSAFDPFFPDGAHRNYWKAIDLENLEEPVIERLVQLYATRPTADTPIPIWHFGGAMSRVPPTATAFWRRRAPFMVSFDGVWDDPAEDQRCIGWVREAIAAMRPFSDGGQYVNFAGLAEDGEAQARAAYGDNYDRLVAIKRKVDPTNLFRLNVNIAPK